MFGESGFTHGDLIREHNEYVGRSPKVNGALCRDTYRISDLKGNLYEKQAISGHKNVEQTARYDRKIAIVPVVDGQVERKNIMK